MRDFGGVIIRACDAGFDAIESIRRLVGRARVEIISTVELRSLLADQNSLVTLIDVRSEAEQAVSRIPGAVTQHEFENAADSYPRKHVVTYCTVGGRSYLYARRLVAAGIDARNYRDGILGWCRAGLPLESPEKEVTVAVHPYWRIFQVPEQYEVNFSPIKRRDGGPMH